jgi:hypothetical protein
MPVGVISVGVIPVGFIPGGRYSRGLSSGGWYSVGVVPGGRNSMNLLGYSVLSYILTRKMTNQNSHAHSLYTLPSIKNQRSRQPARRFLC